MPTVQPPAPDHETDRTDRIVLHRERRDFEAGDMEILPRFELKHTVGKLALPFQVGRSRPRRAERNRQLVAEDPAPLRMIVVLVGQERGTDSGRVDPELFHAAAEFLPRKPHVDDNRSFLAGENEGMPRSRCQSTLNLTMTEICPDFLKTAGYRRILFF